MKCKSKLSDDIYEYEYKDNSVVFVYNDKGFKILMTKPMFERCYIIEDEINGEN